MPLFLSIKRKVLFEIIAAGSKIRKLRTEAIRENEFPNYNLTFFIEQKMHYFEFKFWKGFGISKIAC